MKQWIEPSKKLLQTSKTRRVGIPKLGRLLMIDGICNSIDPYMRRHISLIPSMFLFPFFFSQVQLFGIFFHVLQIFVQLLDRFQYAENFKADKEVKLGLYKTIERMYPNLERRIEVDGQLTKFKNAEGMFGMSSAVTTKEKKQPIKL